VTTLQFETVLPDAASIVQRVCMQAIGFHLAEIARLRVRLVNTPELFFDREKFLIRIQADVCHGPAFLDRRKPHAVEYPIDLEPITPELLDALDVWVNLWNLYAVGPG
jgi:hypothetical protein